MMLKIDEAKNHVTQNHELILEITPTTYLRKIQKKLTTHSKKNTQEKPTTYSRKNLLPTQEKQYPHSSKK
ncbi:3347_t:CDS:2, partial [Scutellospora calospora]